MSLGADGEAELAENGCDVALDGVLADAEVVTNAIRHGTPGGPVRLAATPKPEFLWVQVTDEGPGFVPRPRRHGLR